MLLKWSRVVNDDVDAAPVRISTWWPIAAFAFFLASEQWKLVSVPKTEDVTLPLFEFCVL